MQMSKAFVVNKRLQVNGQNAVLIGKILACPRRSASGILNQVRFTLIGIELALILVTVHHHTGFTLGVGDNQLVETRQVGKVVYRRITVRLTGRFTNHPFGSCRGVLGSIQAPKTGLMQPEGNFLQGDLFCTYIHCTQHHQCQSKKHLVSFSHVVKVLNES